MSERHRLPRFVRALLARRLARPVPARDPQPRSAALYKVDRIGDFVLATGAVRTLVAHFGAAHTRLIVSEEAAPFAQREFPEVACWTAPANASGVWRTLAPLRQQLGARWATERYEHLVCLRHARSLYRDLSLTWLHAASWHGLEARPTAADLALSNVPVIPAAYPPSAPRPWNRELLAHRAVVRSVLQREPTWDELRPRLAPVASPPGAEVVLCPFGSDPIRDYPLASWCAALQAAVPAGTVVRVLGPAARRAELAAHAAAFDRAGLHCLVTANASPLEFLHYLAQARLILTVESAAAHIAAALDRPAVILVGGGHYGWFAPWGDSPRQRWVHHRLPCYECRWECTRPTVECLVALPATTVAQAIREVLPRD